MSLSQDESMMGFVAFCIESCAKKGNVTPKKMYERMERAGIIKDYLMDCYDILHTEGVQSVTYERAMGMFYYSETMECFRNHELGLYLQSDNYIVNDYVAELSRKQ